METIKIYIENIFRSLPETDEVLRARDELGAIMEDKYNELKAAGKSENEAIGIVISEFGNIDELISGIDESEGRQEKAASVPIVKLIEKETVAGYLKTVRNNAIRIPIGIFLIFIGVVMLLLFSGLEFEGFKFNGDSVMEQRAAIGLVLMLIMLIAGVMIIVFNALQLNEYTVFDTSFRLTRDAEGYAREMYRAFAPKKIWLITAGVFTILISILAVIASSLFTENAGTTFGVCAMLILIGIGIIPLVYAGMHITAFDKIMQKYNRQLEQMKKSARLISAIGGAYWCLVTAIYLLFSFVTRRWDISWVIWVVAGLIFGGISAFITMTVKD